MNPTAKDLALGAYIGLTCANVHRSLRELPPSVLLQRLSRRNPLPSALLAHENEHSMRGLSSLREGRSDEVKVCLQREEEDWWAVLLNAFQILA